MKILLLPAPTGMKQHSVHAGANYPLALCQIAAQLDSRHEVRGYDPDLDKEYPASLERLLRDFDPELVGFGFRIFDTTLSYEPRSYVPELHEALRLVKRVVPRAITAVGGSGFSFFARPLMEKLPEIDIGFYLAAERSFAAIADDPRPGPHIPGILYREGDKVHFTGPPEKLDLDRLAMPDFDLFPLSDYMGEDPTAIGIESKRGCKMKCVPCVYPFLTGEHTVAKSPGRVVAEAEELVRRSVPSFFFLDSIFNLPHDHAVGIAEALRQARLPIVWGAFFNAARFDDDLVQLYYEAGARRFYFSFDGISPRAMRLWKRPVSWEQQRRAIELVKARPGTHVHVSFLFGSPGESLSDLAAYPGILAFLARQRVFSMSLSFARIYPATKLHEIALKEGVVGPEDDLLEPVFYRPFPSSLAGIIFHPVYRAAHAAARVRKRLRG